MANWTSRSWRDYKIQQLPQYENQEYLDEVCKQLSYYPPLVFGSEIEKTKKELASVAKGESFLIQGGDCAESFAALNVRSISNTFRILHQVALMLHFSSKKQILICGRIAGQLAKPRSSETETQNGITLPSYKGDILNGVEFNETSRSYNPKRMLEGYFYSAAVLNFLRSMRIGGYGNLANAENWILDNVSKSEREKYLELVHNIKSTSNHMEKLGDFFISHEALHLYYEEALVREAGLLLPQKKPVATSAHFLWIGDRTRDIDSAHVEFLSGVDNPIGLKCGPSLKSEDLKALIEKLNPDNEQGKLTLIVRSGAGKVEESLPRLIKSVKEVGANVIWCCDPMHGNTKTTNKGIKTRYPQDIKAELGLFFKICNDNGVYPGGIHLEMTGNNVVECGIGSDDDITPHYESLCDPRLNDTQTLDVGFYVSELIKK